MSTPTGQPSTHLGFLHWMQRFASVTDAIRELPYCQGYCYTQLTDVMQEINGLLSPDRQPKVDPESFRKLNGNPKGR